MGVKPGMSRKNSLQIFRVNIKCHILNRASDIGFCHSDVQKVDIIKVFVVQPDDDMRYFLRVSHDLEIQVFSGSRQVLCAGHGQEAVSAELGKDCV